MYIIIISISIIIIVIITIIIIITTIITIISINFIPIYRLWHHIRGAQKELVQSVSKAHPRGSHSNHAPSQASGKRGPLGAGCPAGLFGLDSDCVIYLE